MIIAEIVAMKIGGSETLPEDSSGTPFDDPKAYILLADEPT